MEPRKPDLFWTKRREAEELERACRAAREEMDEEGGKLQRALREYDNELRRLQRAQEQRYRPELLVVECRQGDLICQLYRRDDAAQEELDTAKKDVAARCNAIREAVSRCDLTREKIESNCAALESAASAAARLAAELATTHGNGWEARAIEVDGFHDTARLVRAPAPALQATLAKARNVLDETEHARHATELLDHIVNRAELTELMEPGWVLRITRQARDGVRIASDERSQ